jgi:hypothetical protein
MSDDLKRNISRIAALSETDLSIEEFRNFNQSIRALEAEPRNSVLGDVQEDDRLKVLKFLCRLANAKKNLVRQIATALDILMQVQVWQDTLRGNANLLKWPRTLQTASPSSESPGSVDKEPSPQPKDDEELSPYAVPTPAEAEVVDETKTPAKPDAVGDESIDATSGSIPSGGLVSWCFADIGALAYLNPLRWSDQKSYDETLKDISRDNPDFARPLRIQEFSGLIPKKTYKVRSYVELQQKYGASPAELESVKSIWHTSRADSEED